MNESGKNRGEEESLISASLLIPSLALRNSEVEFPLEARTPLFQAELAINEGRIILEPSLDEVQGAFLQAVDKMVAAFRSVLSVDKGSKTTLPNLTHPPSHPSDIFSHLSILSLAHSPPPLRQALCGTSSPRRSRVARCARAARWCWRWRTP